MTAIARSDLTSGVLQTWLNKYTLKQFEPNTFFMPLGMQPMIDDGYNTLAWAKFDQIATSSVATLTDGVSPTDTDFDATIISVSPTQYGVVVNLADMVVERSKIDFLKGAAKHVAEAMARKIDALIQTTIMAGTNVKYAGSGNAARADLASTDYITADLINYAQSFLKAQNAPTFSDGYYVAMMHPNAVYDLRASTGAGSWLDVNKYADPSGIFKGEVGRLHGVRIIENSHVQTFASTTTVYPTLVFGPEAYGVGKAQNMNVYFTPATPSDSDPLAQRRKVGAKVAFGTTILQQNGMLRIESAATDVASD